jgi:hypothetical protein
MKQNKRKNVLRIIVFSAFLILIGCNPPGQNYGDFYKNVEEHFDYSQYNHLPETSIDLLKYYFKLIPSNKTKENGSCGTFLITQTTKKYLIELEKKLKNTSVGIYEPNDKCILTVNLFSIDTAGKIFLEYYFKHCGKKYIPIPNFLIRLGHLPLVEYSEKGFLTKDFDLYVIEAEQGEFIENNYLTNGVGLPDNWKNGYSKGIALNMKSNVAIYWFEIW